MAPAVFGIDCMLFSIDFYCITSHGKASFGLAGEMPIKQTPARERNCQLDAGIIESDATTHNVPL